MSQTSWRPTNTQLVMPHNTAPIAERTAALARLPWLSPTQALELSALTQWSVGPKPGVITENFVVKLASQRLHVSQKSGSEAVGPIYRMASQVCDNLHALAAGQELQEVETGTAEEADEWLSGVISTLHKLDSMGVLYHFQAAKQLLEWRELNDHLLSEYAGRLLDHPLSVGYSLFAHPWPGSNFAVYGKVGEIAYGLALAVKHLTTTDGQPIADEVSAKARFEATMFFWWLLKGYVYAGATSMQFMLPGIFRKQPSIWAAVKDALRCGLEFTLSKPELSNTWINTDRGNARLIAEVPTEELIARVERRIAETGDMTDSLADMR
jgi:hypothetical protein